MSDCSLSDIIDSLPDIVQNNEDMDRHFYDIKSVASGGFGHVVRGICRESEEARAIKLIPIMEGPAAIDVRREAEILNSLNHPNIVKMFQHFPIYIDPLDPLVRAHYQDKKGSESDLSIVFATSDSEPSSNGSGPESSEVSAGDIDSNHSTDSSELSEQCNSSGTNFSYEGQFFNGEIWAIVMEWCEKSLKEYLTSNIDREPQTLNDLLLQVLDGFGVYP